MRELHIVGRDGDGGLLLASSPDGEPSFRVADAPAEIAAPAVADPPSRRATRHLSPAEIQARLRRGVSPDLIARETGLDKARVARWAAPVEAEMADVLAGALASRVASDDHRSAATLDRLVAAAVGRDDEPQWSVTKRTDGHWRVRLEVHDGAGRATTASWVWDPRERALRPASSRARRISFPD